MNRMNLAQGALFARLLRRLNMNRPAKPTSLLVALAVSILNLTSNGYAAEKAAPPSVKEGIEKCEVTAPQGEFAQVTIDFDVPTPWTLLATMRDGRIRVDDTIGLLEPGGWLEVKDGKISGSFRRYVLTATGNRQASQMGSFEVEGAVKGDVIYGACKLPGASTNAVGKISGKIVRESALTKANAVPATATWDSFLGSAGMGSAAVPSTTKLLEEIGQARLAWRSEEPVGQGLAPLTRFMWQYSNASILRTSSGSFSPVLGDGKVFIYMRVPRRGPIGKHHGNIQIDYETDAKKAGLETAPLYVNEKGFEVAEEVVVAMDAATGKTLWRAEVGLGVPNNQGHKERNSDRTPAYADGKVFVPGRAGYVYAFDANTGKPLWQSPCRDAEAIGLIATADVVVSRGHAGDNLAHWQGLDPKTGAVLWTTKELCMSWSPSRWVHGGQTYIVAVVNAEPNYQKPAIPQLVCLDPTTGKPLWTTPVPKMFSHAGVTVRGDMLMGYFDLSDPAMKKEEGHNEDGSLKAIGKPVARAYKLTAKGAEQVWEYPGVGYPYAVPVVVAEKYAFVCSAGEILFTGRGNMKAAVMELATGKVTDEQPIPDADGGKYLPCNGGYVQALGNLVYTRIDGTHGGNAFAFYTISAQGKIVAKTPWQPPQYGGRTHTTSYHHPIMYPLADGRMFLRQYDGIYCYDLRVAPKPTGEDGRANNK